MIILLASRDNYKRKSTPYSGRSIMENSESDNSSYIRPYKGSDDDFPRSMKQKRHQGSANDRHQSSASDRYQSSATDKHQSRATDIASEKWAKM